MKLIATIVLLVGMSSVGTAQVVPTFSRLYAQDTVYQQGADIFSAGDSLVLVSSFWTQNPLGNNFQGYYFIKTDLSGNEAYRMIMQNPNTFYGGIFGLQGQYTSDGKVLLGASRWNSSNIDSTLLIKLNDNLTIDYQRYIPNNNSFSYLHSAKQLSDNNYIVTGQAGYMDNSGNWLSDNAWMAKTDTAGNVIWQVEEAHSNYSGFAYAGPVTDGFIVQLGVCTPINGNEDSIIEVRKYDNNGNLKWTTPLGIPGKRNGGGPLIATQDGGAVQVLNVLDTVSQDSSVFQDPGVIYKLDSNGNIQWQYWLQLIGGQGSCNVSSMTETRSGSIVLVESLTILPLGSPLHPHLGGAFLKLSNDGNTIWQNLFFANTVYDSRFYDVTEAADGGIAAIGQATDSATRHQATWLVKVDSNGCMNGVCPTNYTNITNISAEQGRFMVFPNPAGSQFTVAVTETSFMQDYRDLNFTLYDLTGRMVYEQSLTEQATTIQRGDMPTGMYIWHISDAQRNIANGKMVIR
jgi:hypothetical protein